MKLTLTVWTHVCNNAVMPTKLVVTLSKWNSWTFQCME